MTDLLWTFPVLMAASIVIGWAAESLALKLSAGIALAILAWLQTAPEFAVEASIAWHQDQHLALANLTGSLRLLMGLGWPVILFIAWGKTKKTSITLPENFAVEAAGLAIPVLYFFWIYLKATWTAYDGAVLCAFYGVYFWLLNVERKMHVPHGKQEKEIADEDEHFIVRALSKLPNNLQWVAIAGIFAVGGAALIFTVHPFIESLKKVALSVGVSEFIFIQWIAPIASEFPEKVTAFNWARKPSKVPFAIVNMLSSVTSQWTLLAGLVPIIFSISAGHAVTIELTHFQRTELLLTIVQSALAVLILADLKILQIEAIGLFSLWLAQFLMPNSRETLVVIYLIWIIFEATRLAIRPSQMVAWRRLRQVLFRSRS